MRPLFSATKSKTMLWISITGGGFILALLGMILLSFFSLEPTYAWFMFTVGMLLGVIFGTISLITTYKDARNYSLMLNERIELMESTYGISLSDEEYLKLEYPLTAPAQNVSSSYGTTFLLERKTEVALVWDGSEFQLTSMIPGSAERKELARATAN